MKCRQLLPSIVLEICAMDQPSILLFCHCKLNVTIFLKNCNSRNEFVRMNSCCSGLVSFCLPCFVPWTHPLMMRCLICKIYSPSFLIIKMYTCHTETIGEQ